MRRKSYAAMNCSVAQALDVVGDPWTLLLVRDALWGFRRFQDFHDRLGIPRTTLADRLERLVDAEVLTKALSDPPRVRWVGSSRSGRERTRLQDADVQVADCAPANCAS